MNKNLVVVLGLLTAVLPSVASAPVEMLEDAAPARFVAGFHDEPGLRPGDSFHGARVVRTDDALRFAVVEAEKPVLFQLEASLDERVRYVEPDPLMDLLQFTPNDPRYPSMYGPQQIGAPAAWDRTLGSTSVTLCTVDTGVRYTHQDLTGRWGGGIDYVNGDNDPWDDNGHGTHVTGTATATTNNAIGIAGIGQTTFKHAKVLNSGGSGTWANVASGIRWCADNGAHSISISLGGSSGSTAVEDAVNYAWGAGAVLAAAAGNSGPCSNCVIFPARYVNTIAVSCTTSSRALCSFSSTGPEVDLAAPGSAIDSTYYSSDTSYASLSGTSMSTPHVAGAVALLKADNPTLTNAQIRAQLEGNAEDLGAVGRDNSFGCGLVRPDLAMVGSGTCTSGGGGTPSAPLGLSARHQGNPGSGRIRLSWSTPTSDGGSPITNYDIYRGTTSGGETFLVEIGTSRSYTDSGLTTGQTYYYQVTARNVNGEGPRSNEASAVG